MLSFPVFGEQTKTPVTLNYFLSESRKNYPQFKKQALELEITQAQLIRRKAVSDTQFNLNLRNIKSDLIPEGVSGLRSQNNYHTDLSLEKYLSSSGSKINLGMGIANVDKNYTNVESKYLSSYISLQFTQPLMKNWLGLIHRIPIEQARLDIAISEEKVKELDEYLLNILAKYYYDWVLAVNQLEILKTNCENARIQFNQIKEKHKSGFSDTSDLKKAEAQVIKHKKMVLLAEAQLSSVKNEISKYLFADGGGYEHIYPEVQIDKKINNIRLYSIPIEGTRKMKILKNSEEILKKELMAATEKAKPELNLMLSSKLNSYSVEKNLSDKLDYRDFETGLFLLYPFGNRMAKSGIQHIQTEINKITGDIAEFKLNYKSTLYRLIRMIKTYKDIINEDSSLIKTTKAQLTAEELKYSQGRLDLYFIIETKNKLLDTELYLIKDKIILLKLYLDYMDITDNFQELLK